MAVAGIVVTVVTWAPAPNPRPAVPNQPSPPLSHPASRTGSTTPVTTAAPASRWQVAWGSTMAWGYGTVADATVRTVADIPVDAAAVKVRVSNQFGTAPLVVGAATLGRSLGGAAVATSSIVRLSFAGLPSTVILPGGSAWSDPVSVATSTPATLAVSVFVRDRALISAHYPCCEASTPSFVSAAGSGDLAASVAASGFGFEAPWSRLVDAIAVERPAPPAGVGAARGSIVVVGDSITDGFNSGARWTNLLQQRISQLPLAERPAVVNEGNTANTLTSVVPNDAGSGGAPPGLERLSQDALGLPGVSTVVVFLGTNDLYFGAGAPALIGGYRQAAAAARAAGVRVVAVTVTPRAGSEGWDPTRQARLEQVNQWLLTSDRFDAVINVATALADIYNGSCQPTAMLPAYDSGDHLHPDTAGATAMANAVKPAALGLPPVATIPPAVVATPTLRCAGVPGIPAPTGSV